MTTLYIGTTQDGQTRVTVNGCELRSIHTIEHGCSYGWGYHGHGSRYLAEALLINLGYSTPEKFITVVSENVLSRLPKNWQFTENELRLKFNKYIL